LLQLRRLADGRETRLGEHDDGKEKSVLMPHALSVPEHLVTTSKLHAYIAKGSFAPRFPPG